MLSRICQSIGRHFKHIVDKFIKPDYRQHHIPCMLMYCDAIRSKILLYSCKCVFYSHIIILKPVQVLQHIPCMFMFCVGGGGGGATPPGAGADGGGASANN